MQKVLALLILCLIAGVFFWNKILPHQTQNNTPSTEKSEHHVQSITPITSRWLFVPYWTLDKNALPTTYSGLMYFGVTAGTNGINTTEEGYTRLPQFVKQAGEQKIFLTLRLIDSATNEKVLTDKTLQKKIITDTLSLARQYGFVGVVLDLEYNALAFDSVVHRVTSFSTDFSDAAHSQHMLFYQTLYGDTFYRLRPFDVAKIGQESDGIFIMAYDLHKANGDPGPNFPLASLADEDYSIQQMLRDFTEKVAASKITVIFGLFGYDWTMNNKNQSLGQANALTTAEAESRFLPSCLLKECKVKRDQQATEQRIEYTDAEGRLHEVWFEDKQSLAQKQQYVQTQGISSIGFWAYSYF